MRYDVALSLDSSHAHKKKGEIMQEAKRGGTAFVGWLMDGGGGHDVRLLEQSPDWNVAMRGEARREGENTLYTTAAGRAEEG